MSMSLLQVHELEKQYGEIRALEKVTFQVCEGEIFGLLGPNGAGKTTLLSVVSGLLAPSAGDVKLGGVSLLSGNAALKRQIGIVPQELAVYAELTARENLAFFGGLYGMSGEPLARSVEEVLAAVGLTDRADHRVRTYSGGMKRRLNLGAALVHHPKLLLLDEPTVGVDAQSRNHIFEEVRRLNAGGVTIVYTSHYMEEVQALCTRVGIIDHGRLIACDTLSALLEAEVRLRVRSPDRALVDRLRALPKVRVLEEERGLLVKCRDLKQTLVGIVGVLNELRVELLEMDIQERSLERVFLRLTDTALRD
jgi:ABC-2 type transport system ATP-binding protein